jgi:AraC-like DNA-binding protein
LSPADRPTLVFFSAGLLPASGGTTLRNTNAASSSDCTLTPSEYQNLSTAALGSPKRLLVAAKVLRGFGYLRDPGYSVLDVSIKLGYKTARIFSHHWVSVFGETPARVRSRLTDEAAVESVLRWIRSTEDDSDLPEDDPHSGARLGRRRRRWRREPG